MRFFYVLTFWGVPPIPAHAGGGSHLQSFGQPCVRHACALLDQQRALSLAWVNVTRLSCYIIGKNCCLSRQNLAATADALLYVRRRQYCLIAASPKTAYNLHLLYMKIKCHSCHYTEEFNNARLLIFAYGPKAEDGLLRYLRWTPEFGPVGKL